MCLEVHLDIHRLGKTVGRCLGLCLQTFDVGVGEKALPDPVETETGPTVPQKFDNVLAVVTEDVDVDLNRSMWGLDAALEV